MKNLRREVQIALTIILFMIFKQSGHLILSVTLYFILISGLLDILNFIREEEIEKKNFPTDSKMNQIKKVAFFIFLQLLVIGGAYYLTWVMLVQKREMIINAFIK